MKTTMAVVTETDPLIPLRNGPAVPESILLWMLDAESRGLTFRADPDGRLHVGPRAGIRADDDRFIRQHRDFVLACVRYIEALPPC